MKVIGFTNKFYTLWDVTEETRPLGNGRSYIITHFCYIKNISFDKDKALAAYPNTPVDESLRGKTASFETKKEVWDNVNTFRFGKYAYMRIDENTDYNYIAWYWDQVYNEHRDFVSEYLKKNGYEVRTRTWESYDGTMKSEEYLVSPDELKAEEEFNKELIEAEQKLKNGEPITFVPESNLSEEGEYRDGLIDYKFPEVKEMEYRSWYYWIPVKNGKAKRFKNKNVTITSYNYIKDAYGIHVNVIDFEINK